MDGEAERIDDRDLAACLELLRRGSKSFHAASRLLPRRARAPVAAAYAFCRVADDAVDDAELPAAGLARLHERLEAAYAGRPADRPVDRAFAAVVRRYRIPHAVPAALLEGFRWDVEGRSYRSISDVLGYAARVASAVGVLMTLILEVRSREALARACDLGAAMQLTNIARDVGEDARRGRLYLPREWLQEAGVDPEAMLRAPGFSAPLGRVVARLLDEAERLYVRADPGIPLLPRDARAAIRGARLVYADIGRVVRAAGGDSISRRAVTSKPRKLRLLLGAWLAGARAAREQGDPGAPPLPETAFLVEAVEAADRSPRLAG